MAGGNHFRRFFFIDLFEAEAQLGSREYKP